MANYKYGDKTINLVVKAVITLGGKATHKQVDNYLKSTIPEYKNKTRPNLTNVTVNVNRSHWSNNKSYRRTDDVNHENHHYDKLFKDGDIYCLYNPDIHGVWEIYEEEPNVWKTRRAVIEYQTEQQIRQEFELEIEKATKLTSAKRLALLEKADTLPQVKEVTGKVFIRNALVVAEVRSRARGKCERCKKDAPFLRSKDSKPYLEVHHIKPLADGGEDTVANALALCPNCHRELHYGLLDKN